MTILKIVFTVANGGEGGEDVVEAHELRRNGAWCRHTSLMAQIPFAMHWRSKFVHDFRQLFHNLI